MLATIGQFNCKFMENDKEIRSQQAATAVGNVYLESQKQSVSSATIQCTRTKRNRARNHSERLQERSSLSPLPCSSSSSSSPSLSTLPKWNCTKRTFTLLLLLLVFLPARFVHSATFFYGATDDAQNSPAPISGSSELSKFGSGSKLSEEDLKSVYTFCSVLPVLESSGRIAKNEQSREICEKLIVMLRPMFAKRKTPTSSSSPIVAANKKRRRATIAY